MSSGVNLETVAHETVAHETVLPEALAVVIPAHDEEALLPAALAAVRTATLPPALRRLRVLTVVVADHCRDDTAYLAREAGATVVTGSFRNPGQARAVGVRRALRELGRSASHAWIATTDADSEVPADWLVHQLDRAREGWEAVVGTVTLPHASPLAERLRTRYEVTRPSDGEWRHPHVHGANLGVTAQAYLSVGGFPPLGVGEDHALVDALKHAGHRVLTTAACPVLTSARVRGRARGGFADDLAALASHHLEGQQPTVG
ncbi:glycosyltransferase [Streptomyces sp. NPDC002039]|uniref:glycosyltransferase n=1 Tax=Streptomyces sp. NPDC002039 TaxID=3154660 RepID=UPI003322B155